MCRTSAGICSVRKQTEPLVARIVLRGFRLGPGNRVVFHHPELIRQLPRQFHRFTGRDRLPEFILDFDQEHPLTISLFLADHGFPS